jgi:cytochrome c-type biogenesis protein CcsB
MISQLLGVVTLAYLFSGLLFLVAALLPSPRCQSCARALLLGTLAVHTGAFVGRWVASVRLALAPASACTLGQLLQAAVFQVPLSNFYESLVFFAWCLPLMAWLLYRRHLQGFVGVLVACLACLLLAYASLGADSQIKPLMPALKSNWLLIHVATCFLGYAAFALAWGVGLLYLWQARRLRPFSLDLPMLDRLIYQAVTIGFFFLSLGIITGALWAETAWGRYWSWDPKETWSLITWFIYATLLHARLVRGWQGRRIAYLAVAGFLAVLFTYLGVSFLLSGLHSYLI